MTDFEKIAHLIRFGLPLKKVTRETIIDWADKKIKDDNDERFYDLSLAKDSNKIIEFFSDSVTWHFNNIEIRNLILSYYKEYLKNNPELWFEIEEELFNYSDLLEYSEIDGHYDDFLYFLADDIALRKDGYGGLLNMPNDLSAYFDYGELNALLEKNGIKGYLI